MTDAHAPSTVPAPGPRVVPAGRQISRAVVRVVDAAAARADFLRAVRSDPANARVRWRDAVAPFVAGVPAQLPGLRRLDGAVRSKLFVRDLQLLHDVLDTTPAAGRYWVWSGLLLGWAREGRVLPHDLRDADFAYAASDEAHVLAGLEVLARAGFHRGFALRNNDGVRTEHTLIRHGARFEFFRMDERELEWQYFVYGAEGPGQVQLTARLPRRPLEPFEFLDRTWLKVDDHERELAELYGDWRTPRPDWSYLQQGGVVAREPWIGVTAAARTPVRTRSPV